MRRFACSYVGFLSKALALAATTLCLFLPRLATAQGMLPIHWVYNPLAWIESVAYSPDGKLLAVGGDGGVQIFDASTGVLIRCLPTAVNSAGQNSTNNAGVTSVSFSPNSQMLAVGGQSYSGSGMNLVEVGVVEIWSVSNGALVDSFDTAANKGVYAVAFSPNGNTLAVGGQSNSAQNPNNSYGVLELWTVSSGTLTNSLITGAAAGGCVTTVAFSPDGTTLADGGEIFAGNGSDNGIGAGGILELWNVASGNLIASLNTAAGAAVNSVSLSPDGKTLADGGMSYSSSLNTYLGVLETWNVSTGKLIAALGTSANNGVGAVAFSPDGKTLADGGSSGNGLGVLEQWSVSTSSEITTYATANPEVRSVVFSPDGKSLADGGSTIPGDGQIATGVAEVFSISTGLLTSTLNTIANNGASSVALSPDGKTLAYGGVINQNTGGIESCTVWLWNVATGELLRTLKLEASGAFEPVTVVSFSPDSQTLVVGAAASNSATSTSSGILQIWNVSTGTLIKSLPTALNYGVTSVAFSPDGTMIADCGRTIAGGGLELWNLSTGKLITTLDTSANSGLTTVAFSPDGKTLADGGLGYVSGTNFGVLELWDVSTDKLLKSLKTAATNGINSLAFSPDGTLLIDGGYIYNFSTAISNGVLEIWNVSTGQRVASPALLANTAHILSVALSPDGEVLFAGSDSNLQAYSMTNYHLLNYFDVLDDLSNPGPINSVAVSTDDSLLAYGSASGAVVLGGNPYYNPIAISSTTVSPQTVMGGTGSTGTVTLKQAAPAGGDSVALVSSNNAVQVPASVRVEPGATQATFPITTQVLSSNTAVTLTATSGGARATATLNVSNLSVIGVSLNPTSVVGGNSSTATITLSAPAPTGGITTNVTSSSPWAGVPSTITIIGDATQATVTVTTAVVNAQTTATITAGNGTASTSATLTITPATLVSVSLNPSSVAGGDNSIGTAMLSGPAGSAGAVVSLTSSSNLLGLPNIVNIAAGKTSATFTVTTEAVGSNQTATITATLNGISHTATLTIFPPQSRVRNLQPINRIRRPKFHRNGDAVVDLGRRRHSRKSHEQQQRGDPSKQDHRA